ncbi:MAG: hypothetical protein SWH61_03725 [Thermodesulfobacteriota bacterium]|nr:hypothetical protein [Thermodesulfobacteriota bacterium]
MVTEEDHEFNVGFDKKDHDESYAREALENKVDSLGWKLVLTAVIIPCLIAAIVVVGYFHVQKQVRDFQSTGAAEVRKLTSDLSARVNALEERQQEISENAAKSLPDIQKNAEAIDAVRKQIRSTASAADRAVKTAGSLNKKMDSLESSVNRIQETVSGSEQAVAGVRQSIAGLKTDVKDLRAGLATAKEDISAVSRQIVALDKEKASRDELARVLANQTQAYAEKLEAASQKWDQQLAGIENRLGRLEKTLQQFDTEMPAPSSVKPVPAPPSPVPDTGTSSGDIKEESLPQ